MIHTKAIRKWIVSPDGTVVAQAESVTSVSGERTRINQEVVVKSDSGSSYSSSSSSSSASSL